MTDSKSVFIDYIPEGEEDGNPFGKNGYQDFVPPKEPKLIEEDVVEEPKSPIKKK